MESALPLDITDTAIEEIKKIMQHKNVGYDYGLRIGIKGAGCSGSQFLLGFDTKQENDKEYKLKDIVVYIDKKHLLYLFGKELDYIANAQQQGFTFRDKQTA